MKFRKTVEVSSVGALGYILMSLVYATACWFEIKRLRIKCNKLVDEYNELVDRKNATAQVAFDAMCDGLELNIVNLDMINELATAIENGEKVDPESIRALRQTVREGKGASYRKLRDLAK